MCPKEPHVGQNISCKVCGAEYPTVLYVMLDISYRAPCGPGYPTVLHFALDISCRAQFGAGYTYTDYISYRFSTWKWRHPTEFLIGLDISNRVSSRTGYTVLYRTRSGTGYVPQSFIQWIYPLKLHVGLNISYRAPCGATCNHVTSCGAKYPKTNPIGTRYILPNSMELNILVSFVWGLICPAVLPMMLIILFCNKFKRFMK
jgi:hypothetical protein